MLTPNQIDKLGNTIRSENGTLSDNSLDLLQEFRTSYKEPLSNTFGSLCKIARSISNDSIVTYRIKRFESIISKLIRQPKMQLSRMGDIGGCRCIMKSEKSVYRVKSLIERHFAVKTVKDYIKEPKKDGYRSIHLYVSFPQQKQLIEIQLRTTENHNWATLVEITDLLFETKLKEAISLEDGLMQFHLLLSRIGTLSINEQQELADLANKFKYFQKLSGVFSRNYLEVRKQWMRIENKSTHKFFLISASKLEPPKIESFEHFAQAETCYFEKYRSGARSNLVLTHLTSCSYRQISIAYSNYILTMHSFQEKIYAILEELIIEHLKSNNYLLFLKYHKIYQDIVIHHVTNLMKELSVVEEYIQSTSNKERSKRRRKEREWIEDLERIVSNRTYRIQKLRNTIRNLVPNALIARIIILLIIAYMDRYLKRGLKEVIN